jgi:large subunit ribosomal protein L6e
MVKKYEWYPGDDVKDSYKRHKPKAPKIRKSIAPGQVLILLSGRFRGKRVVFLKQLKSGLLAVTGPFKINGVPVKRVNQVYTISTTTKVDIKGVNTDAITDETFTKENVKKTRSHKFFAKEAPTTKCSEDRKKLQKEVDTAVLKNIKEDMMHKYLNARFTLVKSDAPQDMKW